MTLCATCHPWAHAHPEEARAEGLIVSQWVEEPGFIPVHSLGWWWLIDCEGDAQATTEAQAKSVLSQP